MNVSAFSSGFLMLSAGSIFLYVLCLVWTVRAKRSLMVMPWLFVAVLIVLGISHVAMQTASQRELQRMRMISAPYAPLLAQELGTNGHLRTGLSGDEATDNRLRKMMKGWISALPGVVGVFSVKNSENGKAVYLTGYHFDSNEYHAVPHGKPFLDAKALGSVWGGGDSMEILDWEGQRVVVWSSPIGGFGAIESAACVVFDWDGWKKSMEMAATGALMLSAGFMIFLLIMGLVAGEMVHSLVKLRVSKSELQMQGNRIREQMEIISEKNQQMAEWGNALKDANRQLQKLATTDGLTQVMNHKALMEFLSDCVRRKELVGSPCSVILIDVDNFKQLNDQYGHPAGDEALRTIATVMRQSAPKGAAVGRYGGEEFMVILPGASEAMACTVAEELRVKIQMAQMSSRTCTASFGVSTVYSQSKSEQRIIDEADRALYASKRNGKNRVTHINQIISEAS